MRNDVIILQTTWNRPALLRQSLPQVEAESHSIGCRLVIADDQSDDEDTLALLAEASTRGVDVIQRDYVRDPCEPAHALIGLNNLFAFSYILETYEECKLIIKCDDDVVMVPGAFSRMLEMRHKAISDGHDVLMASGLATINEPIIKQFDGYAITDGACNAAVIYTRQDWERFLIEARPGNVAFEGFDAHFLRFYARKYRRGSVCISLTPSLVYHTGYSGTHVLGEDLNRDFAGSLEGVQCR